MIRNQFSGEDAKDFARELRDLYQAGWDLSHVAAPVDIEDYPNPSVYVWLKPVSDAMTRFVEAAHPVHQRLGVTEVPLALLKQAAEFCRAIERAELYGIGVDSSASDFLESLGEQLAAPSKIGGRPGTVSGHDSSSPVGDETSLSTSDPTGEGSPSGSDEEVA